MRLISMFFLLISQFMSFEKIEINSIYINDMRIEYGNIVSENDSDGYINIFDQNNELIKEIYFDNNGYEYFKYIAIVDLNKFIIVCDTYFKSEDFSLPVYRETVLLLYDTDGILIDKEYLYERPKQYHNHNYLLILDFDNKELIYNNNFELKDDIEINTDYLGIFKYQYQGKAYVNGDLTSCIEITYPGVYDIEIIDNDYRFNYTVIVHPDYRIEGEKYGEGFLGDVKIFSFGELIVNQKEYIIGTSLSEVGNYVLNIIGENGYRKIIEFVILPEIAVNDGVTETQLLADSEYNNPIRIFSNAQTMFIGDKVYNSSLIDSPGHYILVIYGINGYQAEIPFLIVPNVFGVENGKKYDNLKINIFGSALLNGKEINGEILITDPGDYELSLLLGNEVYQTINFIIEGKEETVENISLDDDITKYIFLALAIVGGLIILRKK